MLLKGSPAAGVLSRARSSARPAAILRSRRSVVVRAAADEVDVGTAGIVAIAAGLVCNPIMLWSEYTLYTTKAGLPPGPGGAVGAAEGISYLAVLGIVAYSLYTKVQTGSGLPPGPGGALGAVEGISYLTLLGAIGVFGANALGL